MKLHQTQLKWIALITMTIDHIGAFVMTDQIWLRMIGRLSFPIYAFLIAEGYVHTHDRKRYALRLLGFGVITQLLFSVFHVGFVNVLFTFFLGVLAMACFDRGWIWAIPAILLAAIYWNPDYSYYGVLCVLLFYRFRKNKAKQMLAFAVLTVIFTCLPLLERPYLIGVVFGNFKVNYVFFLQLMAIASIPILLCYDGKKGNSKMHPNIMKYFFYIYYPLHIILLVAWQGGF